MLKSTVESYDFWYECGREDYEDGYEPAALMPEAYYHGYNDARSYYEE